jgi:hypothetical protein
MAGPYDDIAAALMQMRPTRSLDPDYDQRAQTLRAQGHDPRLAWIGGVDQFAPSPNKGELRRTDRAWDIGGNAGVKAANLAETIASMNPVAQGERLGKSWSDAVDDPSLANLTDAGVQTAMGVFRPGAALKVLGAGYGLAGAHDLGLGLPSITSDAMAGGSDPLDVGSRARLTALQKKQASGAGLTRAEREEQNGYLATINSASTKQAEGQAEIQRQKGLADAKLESDKKATEQQTYDQAVGRANDAKSRELARDRRFSDTEFGKVYEKTGGAAAIGAAMGLGALHRMGSGTSGALNKYVLPAAEGTAGAFAANSIPLAYNAFLTEPDNPLKRAYEAYGRELPDTHPDKQPAQNYAATMPMKNPIRQQATDEFYGDLLPRLAISAQEGIPGGIAGANLPGALSAMGRSAGGALKSTLRTVGELPGELAAGYKDGLGKAAVASDSVSQVRQAAAERQALADEARRRLGAGRESEGQASVDRGGSAQPLGSGRALGTPQDQPLPPVPAENPSPLTPAVPATNTTSQGGQQLGGNTLNIPDDLKQAIIKKLSEPQQSQQQIQPPRMRVPTDGRLDPAYRDDVFKVLSDHAENGGNFAPRTGLTAPELQRRTESTMADPSISPQEKTYARVLTNLRKDTKKLGINATADQITKYKDDPLAKFAVPLMAGGAAASQTGDDAYERIARALMMHQQGY